MKRGRPRGTEKSGALRGQVGAQNFGATKFPKKMKRKKIARRAAEGSRGKTSAKRYEMMDQVREGEPDPETKRRINAHEAVDRFCDEALPELIKLARVPEVPEARRRAFWVAAGDLLWDCWLTRGNIHEHSELRGNVS